MQALDLQRRLEAQGHTTKVLEAWSPREARRLHVLLVGVLRSEAYAYDLRPFLQRPQGWLSIEAICSGQMATRLKRQWGIYLIP